MVELREHYTSLVVAAAEADGSATMILREDERSGTIYVTAKETETRSLYAIQYRFEDDAVKLNVTFRDGRPAVRFGSSFADGIDEFFPLFGKALRANRIAHVPATKYACSKGHVVGLYAVGPSQNEIDRHCSFCEEDRKAVA